MLVRMHRNWMIHALLVEVKNGTLTLENNLAGFYNIKPLSRKWKFTFTQQYVNVRSSFICNGPTLETAQMSFNGRMATQTVIQYSTLQ